MEKKVKGKEFSKHVCFQVLQAITKMYYSVQK